MSFAAALAKQPHVHKGERCSMCVLLATLPKGDAVDLQAALDDPTFTGAAIGRALTEYGKKLGGGSVQRHRRGDCVK